MTTLSLRIVTIGLGARRVILCVCRRDTQTLEIKVQGRGQLTASSRVMAQLYPSRQQTKQGVSYNYIISSSSF